MPDDSPVTGAEAASLAYLGLTAVMSRAALLARRGRLAQAEELLLPLAADPHAPTTALDLLAKVYAQQGRLEQAQALWARAVEMNPGNPRLRAALDRCAALCRNPRPPGAWRMVVLGRWAARVLLTSLLCALLAASLWAGSQAAGLKREAAGLRQELARLAAPAAAPATAPSPAPAGQPPADLRQAVRDKLSSIAGLGVLEVAVLQEGDTVILTGRVPSLLARYAVESKTRAVPGVKAIDMSGLSVAGTYVVEPGDSLSSIAAAVYGDAGAWPVLAQANRLEPPYSLRVGQTLEVPLPVD